MYIYLYIYFLFLLVGLVSFFFSIFFEHRWDFWAFKMGRTKSNLQRVLMKLRLRLFQWCGARPATTAATTGAAQSIYSISHLSGRCFRVFSRGGASQTFDGVKSNQEASSLPTVFTPQVTSDEETEKPTEQKSADGPAQGVQEFDEDAVAQLNNKAQTRFVWSVEACLTYTLCQDANILLACLGTARNAI